MGGYILSLIVCVKAFNSPDEEFGLSKATMKRVWARMLLSLPLWGWIGIPLWTLAMICLGPGRDLYDWGQDVWYTATTFPPEDKPPTSGPYR